MLRSCLQLLPRESHDIPQATRLKRTDQSRGTSQLLERRFAAAAAELDVGSDRALIVILRPHPELQRTRLRQCVVDVVERVQVDVPLELPETAINDVRKIAVIPR